MKTIKQIADEIGVTKEAVRKQVPTLPPTCVTTGANRTRYIDDTGIALIKAKIAVGANLGTNQVGTVGTPGTNLGTNQVGTVGTEKDDRDTQILELKHRIEVLELEKELEGKSYQEQLIIYKRVIADKDSQITNNQQILDAQQKTLGELSLALAQTTASLQAAQALHAGTMQQQLEAAPISAEPTGAEEPGPADLEPQPEESAQAAAEPEQPRPRWSWWPFGRK